MIRLTGLILLIATSVAVAEPKQLVCSYNDAKLLASETIPLFEGGGNIISSYLPIGTQIGYQSRDCSSKGPNHYLNPCDKTLKLREIKNGKLIE